MPLFKTVPGHPAKHMEKPNAWVQFALDFSRGIVPSGAIHNISLSIGSTTFHFASFFFLLFGVNFTGRKNVPVLSLLNFHFFLTQSAAVFSKIEDPFTQVGGVFCARRPRENV
jgi:hypothetical protein